MDEEISMDEEYEKFEKLEAERLLNEYDSKNFASAVNPLTLLMLNVIEFERSHHDCRYREIFMPAESLEVTAQSEMGREMFAYCFTMSGTPNGSPTLAMFINEAD